MRSGFSRLIRSNVIFVLFVIADVTLSMNYCLHALCNSTCDINTCLGRLTDFYCLFGTKAYSDFIFKLEGDSFFCDCLDYEFFQTLQTFQNVQHWDSVFCKEPPDLWMKRVITMVIDGSNKSFSCFILSTISVSPRLVNSFAAGFTEIVGPFWLLCNCTWNRLNGSSLVGAKNCFELALFGSDLS